MIEWAPIRVIKGRPVWPPGPDIRASDDATLVGVVELPGAAVIHHEDHGVILESMSVDNHQFGDTWHPSVEEAKEVATDLWGADLGEWNPVPDSVEDYRFFVLASAQRT